MNRIRTLWPAIAAIAVLAFAGCGGDDSTSDTIDDTTVLDSVHDDDAGHDGDASHDDEARLDSDDGHTGDDGRDTDSNDEPEERCPDGIMDYFDVCPTDYKCTGLGTYASMETVWCGTWEDPDCCAGGVCEGPTGTFECPADTMCLGNEGGFTAEPCRPMDCGIESSPDCPGGHYCERVPGNCSGPGVCVATYGYEDNLEYTAWLDTESHGRVCGCDGRTYRINTFFDNSFRGDHPTNIASWGECMTCGLLGFSAENPSGFTKWLACASGVEYEATFPDDIDRLLAYAEENFVGSNTACPEGERAFLGNLETDSDGHIKNANYEILCRLVSYYNVSSVTGQ